MPRQTKVTDQTVNIPLLKEQYMVLLKCLVQVSQSRNKKLAEEADELFIELQQTKLDV